jgi:hypothetical protein
MDLYGLRHNSWLTRIALIFSIATAIFAMFLYTQIDSLVNHNLYTFKLQFDPAWYNPYSAYTKLIYICLSIPIAVSAAVLGLSFLKKANKPAQVSSIVPKPSSNLISEQTIKSSQSIPTQNPTPKQQNDSTNTCSRCHKTFNKPLVTLNYINGKPKMEDICPYCYEPIATVEKRKQPE